MPLHNLQTGYSVNVLLKSFFCDLQTMCPDVFRGPWGGSYCRDSPVQTVRKCSCDPGPNGQGGRVELNAGWGEGFGEGENKHSQEIGKGKS